MSVQTLKSLCISEICDANRDRSIQYNQELQNQLPEVIFQELVSFQKNISYLDVRSYGNQSKSLGIIRLKRDTRVTEALSLLFDKFFNIFPKTTSQLLYEKSLWSCVEMEDRQCLGKYLSGGRTTLVFLKY